MKVGDSVKKAIDDWQLDELEAAMLHACNAIDGTAKKIHPNLGNKASFTQLLRDNYAILGPMGLPGINLIETRFPIKVKKANAAGGKPDLADVIYGIHRCCHCHGDELPEGFALIPDAKGQPGRTTVYIQKGTIQLSDRIIFGLIAVAVMSPVNGDQSVPDGYHLTFGTTPEILLIKEWWGKAAHFSAIAGKEPMPSVVMDFKEWMDGI